MKIKELSRILKISFIEQESLDDFLEILQDHGMLSEKGINTRRIIWEETEKGMRDAEEDPYMRTWFSFDDWTKEFLIKEAKEGRTNERSRKMLEGLGLL